MRITWAALRQGRAAAWTERRVEIAGWCFGAETGRPGYFILTEEAGCCAACLPREPERRIEVFAAGDIARPGAFMSVTGTWRFVPDDAAGWHFQLHDATLADDGESAALHPGFARRRALAASGLLGLAAFAPTALLPHPAHAEGGGPFVNEARSLLADIASVDLHSHAGSLTGMRRIAQGAPFTPVAAPMRAGGMAVICLTVVADSPAIRVTADRRIEPFRVPAPGELYLHVERGFARADALVREQALNIITDAAGLRAARPASPSVIMASEGADFLEGRIERVDEAFSRWRLRHLQLTHYRPNELGDIQTEAPVHGGLTDFGAEVVRRCNHLGIVVDVAHGPFALVKRAAEISTKPLVLSHTSLSARPGERSRLISPDHAKLIARTGGVIGIWPPSGIFPDMTSLAEGIALMADVAGVDHVGIGSDMMGLTGASTLPDYDQLPYLAAALLARGFNRSDVAKIMGGNYVRVFERTLS
jgi:membrane dipeptidase